MSKALSCNVIYLGRRNLFGKLLRARSLTLALDAIFRKKTAASKLVVPAIVFCVAFVICVFVATITLQTGIASWCDSVETLLTRWVPWNGYLETGYPVNGCFRCSSVRNVALTWAGKTTYIDFFPVLIAGQVRKGAVLGEKIWIGLDFQVLAWIASFIWLANLITLSKRLYHHVDFPDYFFRPFSSNNHDNAVQSETDSD